MRLQTSEPEGLVCLITHPGEPKAVDNGWGLKRSGLALLSHRNQLPQISKAGDERGLQALPFKRSGGNRAEEPGGGFYFS